MRIESGFRWRRLVAVFVVLSVVASACSSASDGASDSDSPRSDAPAAVDDFVGTGVFGGQFTDETVDDGIARLAESGIAVVPDGGGAPIVAPASPASPLSLLRWQARNLVLDAASGSGFLGADLDDLVVPDPAIPDAPLPSQVLAAYVHGVDTPGATLSRELVGDQDLGEPETVVFPAIVVTLFASDVAAAAQGLAETAEKPAAQPDSIGSTETTESAASARPSEHTMLDGEEIRLVSSSAPICPDFAGFINEVISDVVKILKLPNITVPDTGIPILTQILQAGADLFVGFVNFAIDAAATFLIDGIKVLLKPVFSVVTTIAAVFAVISQIVNALKPWSVQTTPGDISVHRGVGAPATQEITLQVTVPGLEEWPDYVQSCAGSLGVTLPPLQPHGGRVEWDHIDFQGLTTIASQEDTLDDESKARITLNLGQETSEEHTKGKEHTEIVKVNASLRRQEVEDFKDIVHGLVRKLFDGVPQIIRTHLNYYTGQAADLILDSIADEVIDISKAVFISMSYHGPPQPDEPPSTDDRDPGTDATARNEVCNLLTDDEIRDILGFEVKNAVYNPDVAADGSNQEHCIKADAENVDLGASLEGIGWPPPAQELIERFGINDAAYVQVLLPSPAELAGIDNLEEVFLAEMTAIGFEPVDGVGDAAVAATGGIWVLANGRVAMVGTWLYGNFAPEHDLLELGRIVADRL